MISIIKLTNGIEIIGESIVSNASHVVLSKPLQINYRYFVSSVPSVSFVRYIMFAEAQEIAFDRMHIINEVQPREAFQMFYQQNVEHYYTDLGKMIDDELTQAVFRPRTEDDHMRRILESMSVEGVKAS